MTGLIHAGPISSGGGDPKAIEFLKMSQEVCQWATKFYVGEFPEIISCRKILDEVQMSLNSSEDPKIRFTDEPLFDNGVSKVAIYEHSKLSVTVNRALWDQLTTEQKYVTASIEMGGLSQVQDRYEFGKLVSENLKKIEAYASLGDRYVCNRSLWVRHELEIRIGKACDEITANDLSGITQLRIQQKSGIYEEPKFDFKSGDLVGLNSLKRLSLSPMFTGYLPPDLLTGLSQLEEFVLTCGEDCLLSDLSANLFQGLKSLKKVEIWHARMLKTLPENIFQDLTSLEELTFFNIPNDSDIGFESLPGKLLQGLNSLRKLTFWGTQFQTLPSDFFSNLPNLRILNMRHGKLAHLPPRLFSQLLNLKELALNENMLRDIDPQVFDPALFSATALVHLHGNPLSDSTQQMLTQQLGNRVEWNVRPYFL